LQRFVQRSQNHLASFVLEPAEPLEITTMPKQPRLPFFRKSTQSWYVVIHGKFVPLGKDREKAFEKYYALMLGRQPIGDDLKVQQVLGMFLTWCEGHRSQRTYEWYRDHLKRFREYIGATLTVANLKPHHVESWLDSDYAGKSCNYRHGAVRSVVRVMNWLVKGGHIPASPIANVERPPAEAREAYITPDQWIKALAMVKPKSPFRDFLNFLRLTGCRPQEARAIESQHFDRFAKTVIFAVRDSKGKKEKRVIPLHREAVAMLTRLALKYPTGKLFRTQHGQPWSKDSIVRRFRRMRDKLGFPLFAYAIRHTYATDALLRGIDPVTVATIMGHKDAKMILKVYQHINLNTGHIADAVNKAVDDLPVNPPQTDDRQDKTA
jgi:integrase